MTTLTEKWLGLPALTTYLTTELDALANAANKLGAAIDCAQATRMLIELSLAAQGSARSAGASVAIYMVKASDGSTYEYGADALTPAASALVAVIPFDAATNARVGIAIIEIPGDLSVKLLVQNNTGQAFAANSSTLKYCLYNRISE